MSGWLGELESMRGDRGYEEKKDAGIDFSGGVTLWDRCKLGTELERVVLTSSRTARSTTLRPNNSGVLFPRPRPLGGEFLLMTMGARQQHLKLGRSSAN